MVMLKDGSKRPAASIFEWTQQHCVKQCALLETGFSALLDDPEYVEVNDYSMGTSATSISDFYEVPQYCMGCASWWDRTEIYQNLIDTRRQSELDYRTTMCVFTKMQGEGLFPNISFDFLFPIFKKMLVPDFATMFPCKKENLGAWLENLSHAEYGAFWTEGNESTHESFGECDAEDGSIGIYALTTDANYVVEPHQFF
jgi:hypothetical protein